MAFSFQGGAFRCKTAFCCKAPQAHPAATDFLSSGDEPSSLIVGRHRCQGAPPEVRRPARDTHLEIACTLTVCSGRRRWWRSSTSGARCRPGLVVGSLSLLAARCQKNEGWLRGKDHSNEQPGQFSKTLGPVILSAQPAVDASLAPSEVSNLATMPHALGRALPRSCQPRATPGSGPPFRVVAHPQLGPGTPFDDG
jgi:hypothetical protein